MGGRKMILNGGIAIGPERSFMNGDALMIMIDLYGIRLWTKRRSK